jgi:hypothetical protein
MQLQQAVQIALAYLVEGEEVLLLQALLLCIKQPEVQVLMEVLYIVVVVLYRKVAMVEVAVII